RVSTAAVVASSSALLELDQTKRLVERAARRILDEHDARAPRRRVPGCDAEVDALLADREAALALEPREVPRELRARRVERIADRDERDALAAPGELAVDGGEPRQERIRCLRALREPLERALHRFGDRARRRFAPPDRLAR